MKLNVPHIVQYQGSKRKLAPQILMHMPKKFNRLIEPFSGMAAISIAVAHRGMTDRFIINDINADIVSILKSAINSPEELISSYSSLWSEQFTYPDGAEVKDYNALIESVGVDNAETFIKNLIKESLEKDDKV